MCVAIIMADLVYEVQKFTAVKNKIKVLEIVILVK